MRTVLLALALGGPVLTLAVLAIVALTGEPDRRPATCDPTFAIVCPEGTEVVLDGLTGPGD